jgi:hypothetical protein
VSRSACGTIVFVKRAAARAVHEIPDRSPLRLSIGDVVQVGARDTDWPEFVFVNAPKGAGWVPARYLSQPTGCAIVQMAYDTTELPTRVGEVLEVVAEDRVSGWLWCRSNSGREGWVPLNTVEEGA